MKHRLALLAAAAVAAVALVGCQNEDQAPTGPPTIIIGNTNINNNGGSDPGAGGPTAPSGTIARVALGCFLMRGPANEVLPDCAAGLVTYTCATSPCTGVMNATPLDAEGKQVSGASVAGWSVVGDCVVPDITGTNSDAFTPPILINSGSCVVSVTVSGAATVSRPFVGL